jgi:hypothetical protein
MPPNVSARACGAATAVVFTTTLSRRSIAWIRASEKAGEGMLSVFFGCRTRKLSNIRDNMKRGTTNLLTYIISLE